MTHRIWRKILFKLNLTKDKRIEYGEIERKIGEAYISLVWDLVGGTWEEVRFKIDKPPISFHINSGYYCDLFWDHRSRVKFNWEYRSSSNNQHAIIEYKPKYLSTYNYIPPNWEEKQLLDKSFLDYEFISAKKWKKRPYRISSIRTR